MAQSPLKLLAAAYLLGWIPLTFGLELLSTLSSLSMRGPRAVVELTFHGLVAVFSAAAGRMVIIESPAAFRAASIAVLASGMVAVQSLYWTVLPRDIAPGAQLPRALWWTGITLLWLGLIRRWRRSSAQSFR